MNTITIDSLQSRRMIKLDQRDIQILSILQNEGRIPKSTLAERVNLSPTPCWERVRRLEQAGLIEGYGAELNLSRLGPSTMVFMQAELESHQAGDFRRFESGLQGIEEVMECWAVGGGLDYLGRFQVLNIDHYQGLVDQILDGGLGLKRYYTYVVTGQVIRRTQVPDSLLEGISRQG